MSGDAPAAPATGGDSGGGSTESSTSSTPSTPSTPAAPAETTAPRSTAQIAHNIIERDANPPEAEPDQGTLSAADAAAAKRFTEEEELLREYGFHRLKRADGSEHTIPRSKVLSMIATGLKRGTERWNGEKATIEKEAQTLREFRDGFAEALRGDESQFIAYISQHDPRYRRFLEQQQAQPQAGNGHAPAPTDEPQADIDLGNGQTTYSKAQLQKWLEWSMDQRLAPMRQREEEQRRQAVIEQRQTEQRERVRGQIAQAQQWPSWGEYEADILKKLQDDTTEAQKAGQRPTMTLKEAYLEVKADRLTAAADPAKVREKVIADINAAPRSTGLRATTEIPRAPGIRSTADIARSIVEKGDRDRRS